ncbi:hypothetical protein MKX08_007572, partial [Trichoderma sp. CBMAI-0020]
QPMVLEKEAILHLQYISVAGSDRNDPAALDFFSKPKDLLKPILRLNEPMGIRIKRMIPPVGIEENNLLTAAKSASMPPYCRANNLTILISSIGAGWSTDYLDKVSPTTVSGHLLVHPPYGNPGLPFWDGPKIYQADKGPDTRIPSGRALILPRSSFSHAAKVTTF